MPRRKQGHNSKEIAPGGHLKKTNPETELVQNESFKSFPTKNDLLIKFKKNATSNFTSPPNNEKTEREYVEATKSLNDSMVSKQEINNNFVELPTESNDNERRKDFEKSDIVFKDGKTYNCLSNIPWNFLNTPSFLNSDSSNAVKSNGNKAFLMVQEPSNGSLKRDYTNPHHSSTIISSVSLNSYDKNYPQLSNSGENVIENQKDSSGTTKINFVSRSQVDGEQMNYDVYASVNDNIKIQSKDVACTVEEKQNCQLPSSIYGMPASTVDKMLINQYSAEAVNQFTREGKTSFLQEILEQKLVKSKDNTSDIPTENKYNPIITKSNFLPSNSNIKINTANASQIVKSEKSAAIQMCNIEKSIPKFNIGELKVNNLSSSLIENEQAKNLFKANTHESERFVSMANSSLVNGIEKEKFNSKLKINIPESMLTDDSNSSYSTESSKSLKCPRITSPQILEQRINKIISNNIAIVDTVDVVWPKRYSKQMNASQSYSNDSESRKSQKCIPVNEEKSMSLSSFESNTKSKLHTALLGGAEQTFGTFRKSHSFSKTLGTREKIITQNNVFSNIDPPARTNLKLTNSVSEEELKGSAIKSLLSLKQGQYSKEKSAFTFDKDSFVQHPQNPEGSIIKDLLLKSKSQEDLRLYNDDSFSDSSYQMKNNSKTHKCSSCHVEFTDKIVFEKHSSICSKDTGNVLNILRDPNEPLKLQEINAQYKSSPSDHQQAQIDKSRLGIIKENDNGPILKKQLLMPLSSCSPPMKRRKVSDSVILPSYNSEPNVNNVLKCIPTKILNNMDVLPHRSRSQSVHLFGGEVQVLDGYRTKKIKIQNLPGAFPTSVDKVSNFDKLSITKNDAITTAVVTIAQPVHNSGGTLHMSTKSSTSNFSPLTLSIPGHMVNEYIKSSKSEEMNLISNNSKHLNMSTNRDIFQPVHNKGFNIPTQISDPNNYMNVLPGPSSDDCFTLSKPRVSPINSFYSPIFSTADDKLEASFLKLKENEHSTNHTVPTVLLTPSSPTYSMAESEIPSSSSTMSPQPNKKFLAPTRPTSLPLKKKPITMVSFGTGTTLVSPETPRPKKSCVQLYLNGHAYTYLGLKCSTRSTYCCIYRPQPMFVLQETNPKLSMYSNWQVVPAKEELSGLTPGQMISFYCSKQKKDSETSAVMSKLGEPLIFTHSSYWTYRAQDKVEQKDAGESSKDDSNASNDVLNVIQDPVTTSSENIRSESVITSVVNKQDKQLLSTDESSLPLDTENTLSDGDVNNSNDEDDDDDCQEDGTESLTDSSQPQPPKRVKIFEGGFKSNEDYTYVRGRGRGKYVCEECGIRCKKPSMLKKHIRTHTDLRPYKCKHCSFAFKTKGNLTKHMKSKAHHKKCTELGIIPVPTTTDDSQIDAEALAKQIEKKKSQFSDGEDADDDDDEDSDESDEECESDASSMIVTSQNTNIKMLTNGHSKKSDSQEKVMDSFDENTKSRDSISKQAEEHEAARSLLDLSAFGEPTQWSTSTGDLTDVTSAGESEVGSLPALSHDQSLLSPSSFTSHPISSTVISSARSRNVSDQWLSTETLGHRPRSYSADIPLSGGKQIKYKLVKDIIAETGTKLQVDESTDSGSKEQYARRYSISVVREARKSRTFNPHDWTSTNASEFNPQRRDSELTDQPMDLSVSRDFNKYKSIYSADIASSFINVVSQIECTPDINIATSLESCMNESYQLKSLPVLSPQVLVGYDIGDNNTDSSMLPAIDDTASLGPSTSRSVYYVQDTPSFENASKQKDTDTSEDPSSPDMVEYAAVCSPVSPPNLEDSSYYYSHESAAQAATNAEDMPSTSRNQAEFIVPSTSSSGNMEEGKCVCRICNKMFAKSSHLRLHVNIHYFERPFRCDNCAVSFRTKGHLQKHKRSVSHYNKVNMNLTFGTPTVDNPRPFKCADCKIAFRIHGHLAKHLRSKMHIMKLECLGKLPFGMYAEMERSGVSLNEIDTTDCNNSLESLQVMAQKLYQRDSRRMRWQGPEQSADPACALPPLTAANSQTLIDSILPIGETLTSSFEPVGMVVGIPVSNPSSSKSLDDEEGKQESSQTNVLRLVSTSIDGTSAISSLPRYVAPQPAASSSQNTAQRVEVPDMESAMSLNRSGTCHICGRHFKSAKFLQVHLYCDHPALTPSTNETPLVDAASSETRDLPCDLCGKRFPNQKILQQHLLSHAQPRPFVCEICDAGFTSSSSLVAHQATHQNNSSASISDNRVVQLK